MLERYEIKVKLLSGKVYNFNNDDGTECKIGDIIKMTPMAHSYENALKAVKHTLNFCHVKYEII